MANIAGPNETAPSGALIMVHTVCHLEQCDLGNYSCLSKFSAYYEDVEE